MRVLDLGSVSNILFVCSGNTCVSPVAKALFEKIISEDERLKGRVYVDSADPLNPSLIHIRNIVSGITLSPYLPISFPIFDLPTYDVSPIIPYILYNPQPKSSLYFTSMGSILG